MPRATDYTIVRTAHRDYSLRRITAPNSGAPVAHIRPVCGLDEHVTAWKLVPLVAMHGFKTRLWRSPAEAVVSTRLMTEAQARRAIAAADTAAEAAP